MSFDNTVKMQKPPPSLSPEVIKATVVDAQQVKNEVARLAKLDTQKKLAEKKRQEKLQDKLKEELNKIKEQALLEQQRVKKEQEKIEQAVEKLKIEKQKIAEQVVQKQKIEQVRKEQEKQKIVDQLRIQKEKEKQQEILLAKIKKEQEQKLQNSLLSEERLLSESNQNQMIRQKEIERYISLQQAKVSRNWISRENFLGRNLSTKLEIRLARDGRVISASIVKSSGDEGLDISAKNAVLKASPLPVPDDDKVFETFIRYRFTFRPDELT